MDFWEYFQTVIFFMLKISGLLAILRDNKEQNYRLLTLLAYPEWLALQGRRKGRKPKL